MVYVWMGETTASENKYSVLKYRHVSAEAVLSVK